MPKKPGKKQVHPFSNQMGLPLSIERNDPVKRRVLADLEPSSCRGGISDEMNFGSFARPKIVSNRIRIPKLFAGQGHATPIFYNPKTKRFHIGKYSFVFVPDPEQNSLRLFRVVKNRIDPNHWVQADPMLVKARNYEDLGGRKMKGKKIMANFIGIEANRKGFLDAPPRTVLPLFLSFLAVQGATHACANNPGRAESYYNELGFVYNQRTGFLEKKLPRVKVQ